MMNMFLFLMRDDNVVYLLEIELIECLKDDKCLRAKAKG